MRRGRLACGTPIPALDGSAQLADVREQGIEVRGGRERRDRTVRGAVELRTGVVGVAVRAQARRGVSPGLEPEQVDDLGRRDRRGGLGARRGER